MLSNCIASKQFYSSQVGPDPMFQHRYTVMISMLLKRKTLNSNYTWNCKLQGCTRNQPTPGHPVPVPERGLLLNNSSLSSSSNQRCKPRLVHHDRLKFNDLSLHPELVLWAKWLCKYENNPFTFLNSSQSIQYL